jgi:hypothetical protein
MSRVSTELTPSERAAFEWIARALPKGYWAMMVFMAGMLIFLWFARGPDHPAFALTLGAWTLALGPGVAIPVTQRLPRHWFRVPASERILHRMLGVGFFRWLLERSGWERHVHKREFHATRAGLPSLEVALRCNAGAHGAGFAIHVLLAALALFTGHPWGALWILSPGVMVHLYPVLLQRSIVLRLQPLLDRSGLDQPALKP